MNYTMSHHEVSFRITKDQGAFCDSGLSFGGQPGIIKANPGCMSEATKNYAERTQDLAHLR